MRTVPIDTSHPLLLRQTDGDSGLNIAHFHKERSFPLLAFWTFVEKLFCAKGIKTGRFPAMD